MDSVRLNRSQQEAGALALRILIVRTGAMGDILHGLPAVAALRRALPDSFIGWAVEPHWMALLTDGEATVRCAAMPLVDRVHEVPTREWKKQPFSIATLRQIAKLRGEMRAEHYDVAVDLQGTIRSAVIGRMSGSARLVGLRRPRERQARSLYGERIPVASEHVIEQACELVSAAARVAPLAAAQVVLPCDREAESWSEDFISKVADPFVLLTPGAGWGAKRWPTERYAALTRRLREQGLPVLANVSAGNAIHPELVGAGALPVPSSVSQLIALTRRAALVIGGDTGPLHLAAALGRPVVALFGPTDPLRNGPSFFGAQTMVLRHPTSLLDHRRHEVTEAGLAQISVADVYSAAQRMLGNYSQERRRPAEVSAHG